MAIPSIRSPSSISPSTSIDSHPSIDPSILDVGKLTIGGHSYTVSIESSESLISTPTPSTLEKIQYLADLHLKHLESQGADLSKVILQQIDEEGLYYVNDNREQKMLPSSDIEFTPYNPFFDQELSFPASLKNVPIASIKEIYNSIIDPLIAKKAEVTKGETLPITGKKSKKKTSKTKNSHPSIIFSQSPQETLVKTINNPTSNSTSSDHRNTESLNEVSKQIEDPSIETEKSNESKLNNLWERVFKPARQWLPSFSLWRSRSYDLIDSAKIVEAETESFLEANPQVQEDLRKFETIDLQ